jgi:hypothetical protein
MARDHDFVTHSRYLRLSEGRLPQGQGICIVCAPWKGENAPLCRPGRKRTDRYKNHRPRAKQQDPGHTTGVLSWSRDAGDCARPGRRGSSGGA